MNKIINVAIDGPAGAGKSTIAKKLSERLGYIYVDTGALYRAVALFRMKNNYNKENLIENLNKCRVEIKFVDGIQKVFLNDTDVSEKIRENQVSMIASETSAFPEVREFLLGLQKKIAAGNNVIMDGRDIGTVVLPNADVKIFLTASAKERANRRYKELAGKPDCPDFNSLLNEIIKRDYNDMHRTVAPLKKADDAVEIDSTSLSLEQTSEKIYQIILDKISKRS